MYSYVQIQFTSTKNHVDIELYGTWKKYLAGIEEGEEDELYYIRILCCYDRLNVRYMRKHRTWE